jgi:hypothetical protein
LTWRRRARRTRPICRLAAGRGLSILCQKPLAPTFAEAASLVAEIGGRVPLMVPRELALSAALPPYRAMAERQPHR